MHAINRILYVFVILFAVLTVLGFSATDAEPTIAYMVIFSGFFLLLFIVSIVALVIGRGRLRAIHRILPIYYLVKIPLMGALMIAGMLAAMRGSIEGFAITVLIGAVLHLLVFLEAIWAAAMLIISRNER